MIFLQTYLEHYKKFLQEEGTSLLDSYFYQSYLKLFTFKKFICNLSHVNFLFYF